MLIGCRLYLWSFGDSEKPHVWPLGSRLGKGEIEHRNAARQSRENITRIAQNGFVEVVKKVNILILAGLFKVKLRSAKILIKARLANSQTERIVGIEF